MSTNPHEAVYDVLRQKAERAREEAQVFKEHKTREAAFEDWTQKNRTAGAASPVRGTR